MDIENLKKLALMDFYEKSCKGMSLIEIYLLRQEKYNRFVSIGRVPLALQSFINFNKRSLVEASKIEDIDERKRQYEKIFNEHFYGVSRESKTVKHKSAKITSVDSDQSVNNNKIAPQIKLSHVHKVDSNLYKKRINAFYNIKHILCPEDSSELTNLDVEAVKDLNEHIVIFPSYVCPKCKKRFTILPQYKSDQIDIDGIKYVNIKSPSVNTKIKCYVYPEHSIKECKCSGCNKKKLVQIIFTERNLKGKVKKLGANICPSCGMPYVNFDMYSAHKENFEEETLNKLHSSNENHKSNLPISKPSIISNVKKSGGDFPPNSYIDFKDFVVRRNIFKCRHGDHIIRNVDAKVKLIRRNGEIIEKVVPAGYCSTCNIYFIVESTFENLKKYGTILCRVSDEKTYLNVSSFVNGMQLAQQSVLMQYGYTVSQQEDLPDVVRQTILTRIIDNHILTRGEVISYLDFFINTKSAQRKYSHAIEKWEADRKYIENYHTGLYIQVKVSGFKNRRY